MTQKQERAFEISRLLPRYISGQATGEERRRVDRWLEASPYNRELLDRLQDNGRLMAKMEVYASVDSKGAYIRFLEKRVTAEREKRRVLVRRLGAYAAAVLLPLLVATFFLLRNNRSGEVRAAATEAIAPGSTKAVLKLSDGRVVELDRQQVSLGEQDGTRIAGGKDNTLTYEEGEAERDTRPREAIYNTLEVPANGEFTMILADGTRVWVGACSRIEYPVSFTGDTREVFLEGEAFFDVAPDASKPFIVRTKEFCVKALGTSFNIMDYTDETFAHATLKTGRVEVSFQDETMELTPGQQAYFINNTMTRRQVDVDIYTAWMTDTFRFDRENIGVIMRMIARWYDVKVKFMDVSASDYHFIGALPKYNDLIQTLDLLEQTTDIRFTLEDDTVVVSKDPRR